jgi:hypothetical protein
MSTIYLTTLPVYDKQDVLFATAGDEVICLQDNSTMYNYRTKKILQDSAACSLYRRGEVGAKVKDTKAELIVEGDDSDSNRVKNPSHYKWLEDAIKEKLGVEVNLIDIIEMFNFNKGNALKYIVRAGHKKEEGYSELQKESEDLQKAAYYIQREIIRVTQKQNG